MSCRGVFTKEFIDSSFTKTFVNKTLKNHRENILFEREKCLLPAAQDEVTRIKDCKKIEDEIVKLRNALHMRMDALYLRKNKLTVEKSEFVRKCPVENCRGFLSTRWKCEVCDNYICPDCNEIKNPGEEHTCDPSSVETVKLLKKDTKPCVSCGTMIFKISGCSQMWCPECHTVFDWNTGRREQGVIHNPHYFEFRRNAAQNNTMGRNPADIPCGGRPTVVELLAVIRPGEAARGYNPNLIIGDDGVIFKFLRVVNHVSGHEIRYNYQEPNHNENMDLRVKYLMNDLDEETMKKTLQKREKNIQKRREIRAILQMFVDVGSDTLRQFILDPSKGEEVVDTIRRLYGYSRESLNKIAKRFNSSVPGLENIFI